MHGVRSSSRSERLAFGAVCLAWGAAACTPSFWPPIAFPDPPAELAADPSGLVTLESVGQIVFRAAEEATGRPLHVVVERRLRQRVVGAVPPAAHRWVFPTRPYVVCELARARLARADGTVVEVDGVAGATAGAEIIVELPLPAPGDLLDVAWREIYLDPQLVPPYVFATSGATVSSSLDVVVPPGFAVRVALGQGGLLNRGAELERRAGDDGATVHHWEEQNLKAVPPEPDAADPQRSSSWATVVLTGVQLGADQQLLADSWSTVAAGVRQRLAATMALDEETRQALGAGLAKARLRDLRALFRPEIGTAGPFATAPRPFAELKSVGRVSALEAAALLEAATVGAVEVGHLALVAPFEGRVLVEELPGLYAFTAAAVAFKTSDGWVFVDPTCDTCGFGQVPLELAGGRALVLSDPPQVVEVPLRALETNRRRLQFNWTLAVDGALSGTLIADLEGISARAVVRASAGNEEEQARHAAIADALLRPGSGITVDKALNEGTLVAGEPLAMRFAVNAKAEPAGDGSFVLPLRALTGASLPWTIVAERQTAALLPAPSRIEVSATLQLPPFLRVELPPPLQHRLPVGEYASSFRQDGKVVTYSRRIGLFARAVPAERWADVRALFALMEETDAQVLRFHPED